MHSYITSGTTGDRKSLSISLHMHTFTNNISSCSNTQTNNAKKHKISGLQSTMGQFDRLGSLGTQIKNSADEIFFSSEVKFSRPTPQWCRTVSKELCNYTPVLQFVFMRLKNILFKEVLYINLTNKCRENKEYYRLSP